MKWKKMMSLLMAGLMAASLGGCTGGNVESQSTAESAVSKDAADGKRQEAGEEGYSEDEQVEVTFWKPGESLEEGVANNAVADEIARITGVRIRVITGDDDKLQVLLAAGDLPDVVYCNKTGAQSPASLIDSGQIITLDELVEKYGDNIKKWGEQALTYSKSILSDDTGSLYFVPMNVSDNGDAEEIPTFYGTGIGYALRWDMYAQAGYPEITDEDSYLQVLAQMQKQFQRTEDGKTVYAIGGWSDWGTWAFKIPYLFANGYGEGKNATLYDSMTGEVELMYYSNGYWNAVRFYNKAYNMGLLDPESFTQSYDDYVAKAKAGQYISLGINGSAAISSINDALQALDPTYGYEYVPCGMNYLSDLYNSSAPYGWGSGNFAFAISINNKYPEETMRLLNFLYSPEGSRLLMCGIEGEDWEYTENGDVVYTEQYKAGVAADPTNYKKNRGIDIYVYLNGIGGIQILEDGTPVDIDNTPGNIGASLTQCDLNYCEYYSELYSEDFAYPGKAVEKFLEDGEYEFATEYTGLVNSLTLAVTDDASSTLTEIDTMMNTDYINLIMLPEAQLEEAIEAELQKIDASGFADLQDTINGLTADAKERAASIK